MAYDKLTKAQLLQKVEELEAQLKLLETSTLQHYVGVVRKELHHLANDVAWLINRTYSLGTEFRAALNNVEIAPLLKH